jgi:hypothetical protein
MVRSNHPPKESRNPEFNLTDGRAYRVVKTDGTSEGTELLEIRRGEAN